MAIPYENSGTKRKKKKKKKKTVESQHGIVMIVIL